MIYFYAESDKTKILFDCKGKTGILCRLIKTGKDILVQHLIYLHG